MDELLNHPAVQTALVPLVVGLLVAIALGPLKMSGLAAIAGLAAAIALIGGFQFSPLAATRKLVLCSLLAPFVGLAADGLRASSRTMRVLLGIMGALAAVWTLWSVLVQKESVLLWLAPGALVAAYTGFLAWSLCGSRIRPVQAGAAGLALGLGTGISAVLAASALLGQYGVAVGAASGGFLLAQMLRNRELPAGKTFGLSVAISCGLLGSAALLLAQLPWWTLPILACIPLAVRLPVRVDLPILLQALIAAAPALIVAMGACALGYAVTRST